MKVGDLVRPRIDPPGDWKGVIIGWDEGDPIVFWSNDFPNEREYENQLEVINEYR